MNEPPKILVVDDEEAIRDSCRQALAKDGYVVDTAENGQSGLQKIKESQPDLVLIDLKMPGMSGMELLEAIGQIDPTIVSVVITGYATIESAVEAMKRNAYDFLPKPFTPDQLRIVIERGLERRRLAAETERLRREKEMMRENFVTLVTHQLRSPLTSVKQYFGVIREGFAGEATDEQKEMIEKAAGKIDRLLELINDWLDMSRVEAGKIAENFERVSLTPMLSEILEELKPQAEARKVSLELHPGDNPIVIDGDPKCLKEAILNLVNNGINYNRAGGSVTIDQKSQDNDLVVEVSDTGIGIPQEDLPFIFDEFFRVKSRETQHIPGTGLGLPIAKKIIEAHKGRMKVASELGRGTTFSILLPKANQSEGSNMT
ncbi:MAG: response regulator [Sedimentisphaerales bacterium]|nr:response regulator [Sedimentisphaerales bacterium]